MARAQGDFERAKRVCGRGEVTRDVRKRFDDGALGDREVCRGVRVVGSRGAPIDEQLHEMKRLQSTDKGGLQGTSAPRGGE